LSGAITLEVGLIFFITAITFALLESLSGIIADELSLRCRHSLSEIVSLILASLVESVFYRPLTNFWRLRGAIASLLAK
jgi:hypothetical protein